MDDIENHTIADPNDHFTNYVAKIITNNSVVLPACSKFLTNMA